MKRIIAVFLCLILILCGCSQDNGENTETQQPDSVISGNLSLYMATPDTLNPLYTMQTSNASIYNLIYDSLIYIADDLTIVPQLAQNCVVSSDCKSIKFTLKSGIVWHDGIPFTSKDVAYTIGLILNTEKPTIYTNLLQNISSVTVQDDLHFSIHLNTPYARIVDLLDFPIVPAHRQDIAYSPCGTGQYKFVSLEAKKAMHLTKNTLWKLGDVPIEETLDIKITETDDSALSMLRMNELSAVDVTASEVASFGFVDKTEILKYPSLKYEFLGFNFSNQIMCDSAVRRAVSAAINRDEIVRDIYFGYATGANSPVPPSSYLYNKDADKSSYEENAYAQILTDGGWSDGNSDGIVDKIINDASCTFNATMLVNSDNPLRVSMANKICEELRACGMYTITEAVPYEEYISRLQSGEYSIFLGGADFANSLDYAFLLSSSAVSSGQNFMLYSSADMDKAIYNTYIAVSTENIKKAYLEFQYVFTRDMPVVGILFADNALIYRAAVKGVSAPCASRPFCSINKWHFTKK